jgi:hypothetical protein
LNALQNILSAGISEKVIEYGLLGVALIVMTWAYAHRVLGFRLLKLFKKKPAKSKKEESLINIDDSDIKYDDKPTGNSPYTEHDLDIIKRYLKGEEPERLLNFTEEEIARLLMELKDKAYSENSNENKQEEKVPIAV